MMCICRHRWATLNFDSLIPFAFRLSIFHFRSILDICVWEWVSVSISTMERILQWIHVHKFNDTHVYFLWFFCTYAVNEWIESHSNAHTIHIYNSNALILHNEQRAEWDTATKNTEIDWVKRDDYRYRQNTDTHTLNERKWEKRKRKTKNEKQKNV